MFGSASADAASLQRVRRGGVKLRFLALARTVREAFARASEAAKLARPGSSSVESQTDAQPSAAVSQSQAAELKAALAAVGAHAQALQSPDSAAVDASPLSPAPLDLSTRPSEAALRRAVIDGMTRAAADVLPPGADVAAVARLVADRVVALLLHDPLSPSSPRATDALPTDSEFATPQKSSEFEPPVSAETPLARLQREMASVQLPPTPQSHIAPEALRAHNAALRRELLSMKDHMDRAVSGARSERHSLRAALADLSQEATRLSRALQMARQERELVSSVPSSPYSPARALRASRGRVSAPATPQ
jgi:hypothetical protein